MWAVARYIDERLVVAMYGDSTMLLREYMTNGLDGGAKRVILNVLTLGLFVALPMVWSGMMAWIGFQVGKGIGDVMRSAHESGAGAGSSAMKATGQVLKLAANKLKR